MNGRMVRSEAASARLANLLGAEAGLKKGDRCALLLPPVRRDSDCTSRTVPDGRNRRTDVFPVRSRRDCLPCRTFRSSHRNHRHRKCAKARGNRRAGKHIRLRCSQGKGGVAVTDAWKGQWRRHPTGLATRTCSPTNRPCSVTLPARLARPRGRCTGTASCWGICQASSFPTITSRSLATECGLRRTGPGWEDWPT